MDYEYVDRQLKDKFVVVDVILNEAVVDCDKVFYDTKAEAMAYASGLAAQNPDMPFAVMQLEFRDAIVVTLATDEMDKWQLGLWLKKNGHGLPPKKEDVSASAGPQEDSPL